jgi:predicted transcriptional regulator
MPVNTSYIKKRGSQLNMNLPGIARKAGIPHQTIRHIIETRNCQVDTLDKIASALGVRVDRLVTDNGIED